MRSMRRRGLGVDWNDRNLSLAILINFLATPLKVRKRFFKVIHIRGYSCGFGRLGEDEFQQRPIGSL